MISQRIKLESNSLLKPVDTSKMKNQPLMIIFKKIR